MTKKRGRPPGAHVLKQKPVNPNPVGRPSVKRRDNVGKPSGKPEKTTHIEVFTSDKERLRKQFPGQKSNARRFRRAIETITETNSG